MIVEGKPLEHGDDPRIRWILGNAETGPLFGPYGLITTGQSLHWMDWEVVLPRFAGALAPGARLAIVDDPEAPQPWSDELRPILIRHSIHRGKWHQFELIGELVRLGLFAIEGELTLEAEPIEQPLEEYIASFHATSSLARHRIGDDEADAFDREVRELLAAHPTVTRRAAARIVWGRPVPAFTITTVAGLRQVTKSTWFFTSNARPAGVAPLPPSPYLPVTERAFASTTATLSLSSMST